MGRSSDSRRDGVEKSRDCRCPAGGARTNRRFRRKVNNSLVEPQQRNLPKLTQIYTRPSYLHRDTTRDMDFNPRMSMARGSTMNNHRGRQQEEDSFMTLVWCRLQWHHAVHLADSASSLTVKSRHASATLASTSALPTSRSPTLSRSRRSSNGSQSCS